jgi:aspartyl-tRNA(Asn)/glutamyl-tRNA(Gln) amidotransferase subunit A
MLTPTLLSTSERYKTKDISPVEVVHALVARIEAVEPKINAFSLRQETDQVLEAARLSERRWRRGNPLGLLDGIPVTIKDTILVSGWPTRFGSRISSDAPAEEDAPAVARLREAGALIVGKTTTPEFGWKAVTDSPLTGISRNPWNPRVTPGGSSGGAAAAVAADLAFASVGTDAGGSVRISSHNPTLATGTHCRRPLWTTGEPSARVRSTSKAYGLRLARRLVTRRLSLKLRVLSRMQP